MKIDVKVNIKVPDIPNVIDIRAGSCLRDVLLLVLPQVIDPITGDLKEDPDIWEISYDGATIHSLPQGLDTEAREGGVLGLQLVLMGGG